ncbi:MAG: glycoside hydrolase TIM-barrel-like domain-containing protein [Alphaproteobacteria bacterium]|nr:glycoside hydrolase TIM-barrel-like domain-containing protein [Alphaproteobacteria bacterium]
MVGIELVSLDNPPIVQTSEQAVLIPKIWGRVRVEGQVIWADEFKLVSPLKKDHQTALGFSLSFAIALCEGEVDHISKIWANNNLHDMTDLNWRFYNGSADQAADPLLEAIMGAGNAPAFRDVAYVVFEDLHLEPFGNMVPKFSFEVVNAIGELERQTKAVALIPGATEFGYHTVSIVREDEFEYFPENQHGFIGKTDFIASIDELCNLCPNLEQVSLVVPWFGDDLRAGEINIKPCVDNAYKKTTPEQWQVNGVKRGLAKVVSQIDERAAFGGTPTDASVFAAIAEFKLRGIKVTFYPFILMDVPADNMLPSPYGGLSQPVYPWRGRVTCDPAIGQGGSVDQTAAATSQIANFFGNCAVANIKNVDDVVFYDGPGGEWGYRRMVLHYAKLCQVAGGVEAFLVGSEFIGLTQVRDSKTHFPAVDQLRTLTDDVRSFLPSTKISYGADWSEYFGYHPQDGTGDVFFHLDNLWAHVNIDFIGIDAYWPLSDWRDEPEHLDKTGDIQSIYNRDYLDSNIVAGEGFDYYYANVSDRNGQIRSPIDDTAYGKHWVFRTKDIQAWWQNSHYNRINGVEQGSPTGWVAESKPIWLTEIGCPAIDKGSNQPNVFYDPNSSEGKIPYFANQSRDDIIQRRYLEVFLNHYEDGNGENPISSVYGDKMLDTSNIFIWAYDARPYPLFPLLTDVWADGDNWNYGHWLNGRIGAVPLDQLILQFTGEIKADVSAVNGQVEGYTVNRLQSPLQTLQDILPNFGLMAYIRDDVLIFRHQDDNLVAEITDLQLEAGKIPIILTDNDSHMLTDAHMKYISDDGSYSYKVTSEMVEFNQLARRNDISYQLNAVLSKSLAARLVANRLGLLNGEQREISLSIDNTGLGLECGDIFELNVSNEQSELNGKWRIHTISTANGQLIDAVSVDIGIDNQVVSEVQKKIGQADAKAVQGRALIVAMNLPILPTSVAGLSGNVLSLAAFVKPWHSNISVFEDIGGSFVKRLEANKRAILGHILEPLNAGPIDRYDLGNKLDVRLYGVSLSSISTAELLAGKNMAAIEYDDGGWEIIQFKDAVLIAQNEYQLSHLIRGRFGTGHVMLGANSTLARFVLLDNNIIEFELSADELLNEIAVKYGPVNKVIEDTSYQDAIWQHEDVALKPFAPVQVQAKKTGDDIELSWMRQTRFGGENWAVSQVPLNEDVEAYEIEIWLIGGGAALRLMSSDSPKITYDNAQQTADFGGLASDFMVKIYQMSAQVGRGTAKEIEVHV